MHLKNEVLPLINVNNLPKHGAAIILTSISLHPATAHSSWVTTMPFQVGTISAKRSNKDSAKPIVYVATEMVLAMVNIKPMDPPNAGPETHKG